MEEKLDSIDEKLCELKNTVESPDCSALFAGFKWTREWFTQAEEVLLALSFRGESDHIVVEFIREKIRETDVRSFNDFLRKQSAVPIKNHYDWIIEADYCRGEIFANNSNAITEYILEKSRNGWVSMLMSSNTNTECIRYLIQNPSKISWGYLSGNNNNLAVQFVLNNPNRIDYKALSGNTNDNAVKYLLNNTDKIDYYMFSANSNNFAVDYLLNNLWKVSPNSFCRNTNDRVVKYLIANPVLIISDVFNVNTNDLAVDYLLANPHMIRESNVHFNTNIKITKYFIDNAHLINAQVFCYRNDDMAVDYILNNNFMDDDRYHIYNGAYYSNTNDRILDYLMKNNKTSYPKRLAGNNCNYNMQKFRAFNALKLLPRINGLVI